MPTNFGDGVFGDDFFGGIPDVYYYTELVPSYDLDNVFNKWVDTRTDGEPQVWEDTVSQHEHGLRVKQITSLVTTDGEARSQAQWKSGIFSQPMNRVEAITIMPLADLTDTGQIDAGCAREVGDRITIIETPPGFSTVQTGDYVIQQLSGQIDVGPITSMKLKFGVWPASTTAFWIIDDADQSLAGISTRPGY
jgi:hypothetical protein